MPKREAVRSGDGLSDIIKDLLIVQLGLAGVRGHDIRKIASCSMDRVNRIVKYLKVTSKDSNRRDG